jgi:CRP-like cAMP-binding protein
MESNNTPLILLIQTLLPVAPPLAQNIAGYCTPIEIAKNDFLLTAGKICNEYLFLEQGFLRAFTLDVDGNEITTAFYKSPKLVFEAASFFQRTHTQESIQALQDCKGWYISFEQLNTLFHTFPEFREAGRSVLIKGFAALKKRMLSMINETAEERYTALLATNPEIFQHASLKQIASYLGITDTSLSRIRKEFSKKHSSSNFLPNGKG